MTQPIRVAIVGLGAVARAVHLPILRRLRDLFELSAICDISAASRAHCGDRFGFPRERQFSELETMLESVETDALMVLTSGSHSREVLAGLERDLVVFCEKPLAYTRREAEEIEGALGGARDRLMIGYMKLYDPAVEAAAELVGERETPRAVDVTVLHPSAGAQLASSHHSPVSDDLSLEMAEALAGAERKLEQEALGEAADGIGPVYSGVMLGSVVHDLAVLRALGITLAEIDHVERWPEGAHPPSLKIAARTGDGVRVGIDWHYLEGYPEYREEIRWHDSRGSVELVFPTPYRLHAPTSLHVRDSSGDAVNEIHRHSPVEAFERQLLAFHAMATDGGEPKAGAVEGAADIWTCQRMAARLAESEKLIIGGETVSA